MRNFIFIVAFLYVSICNAQQPDSCKVLMKEISGDYRGPCKDGYAHGKGVAKGKDAYNGTFLNGLPDGKGTYTYENKNTYTGNWINGVKSGQGKFVFYVNGEEHVQKGYWKNDQYVGATNPDESYRIIVQAGIQNCTIKKLEGSRDVMIRISLVGSSIRYIPKDLKIVSTSGQVRQETKSFVVHKYTTPNNCTVSFSIQTSGGTKVCNLSFDILQAGDYEVVIVNN